MEDKRVCALYARVSKSEQNTESQLLALRQYARRRGFVVFHEYVDNGVSGILESRPALDQLFQDAHLARFEAVIVARFDRLARSTKQLILAAENFEAQGIDFISLAESIDTSTPMGKAFYTVVAAFAQFERDLIRERINLGIARARTEGKTLGRPARIIDRERVLKLHREKKSLREIGKLLNVGKDKVSSIIKTARAARKKARKKR
jgi:DNA invertase Pin-like site-specific DNA recombinase